MLCVRKVLYGKMPVSCLSLTAQSVSQAPQQLLELPAVEDAILVEVEQLVQALQETKQNLSGNVTCMCKTFFLPGDRRTHRRRS